MPGCLGGENIMAGKRLLAVVVLSFLLLSSVAVAAVPKPKDQLQVTVDRIIEILRDKSLPQEVVLEKVADLVRAKFDFHAMSQRTLGINWKKATPAEQKRFVELFSQLLEDTYRGRIKAYTYNDEHVEYLGERIQGSRAEVDTIVVANREIPVSYKMRLKGNEWLIYDVVIEEVSLVSNYRNSYAEIVRAEGFSGLLARMEQKIKELKANGGSGETDGAAQADAATSNGGAKKP
jgi:phospholipid transport system substrate-binding protein